MTQPLNLIVPYAPEWHQWDFHEARHTAYYRWLDGGVGSGKSYAGLAECLILAAGVCPGFAGLIVVPGPADYEDVVRPTIEELWPREIYEIRQKKGHPHIYVQSAGLVSEIYVRTAYHRRAIEKISGFKVAWAYWEEAARFAYGELVHRYTIQRIRQKGSPYYGIHVASTPKPGWLPKLFKCAGGLPPEAMERGYRPADDIYIRQAKTEHNPHNADMYAARQRATYGDSDFGRQELDGAIVQATGLIYGDWAPGLHVVPHAVAMRLYAQSQKREGGIDWGWNVSAMHWGGWTGQGGEILVIVGEWYKSHKDAEDMAAFVQREAPEVGLWYADSEDPENISKFQRAGIPTMAAIKARVAGFGSVRQLLPRRSRMDHPAHPYGNRMGCPRLLVSDRCVHLIREFGEYRDANDPMDNRPYVEGATEGDDHALDDLRYLVHTGAQRHDHRGVRATI